MLPVVGGFGRLTETDMVLAGYQVRTGQAYIQTDKHSVGSVSAGC